MQALTAAERKGAALLVGLLLIGAVWDMWQASSRTREAKDRSIDPAASEGPALASDTMRVVPTSGSRAPDGRLELNRASAAELDALPGIGPVLASRILEQRRRGGPFRRIEDLLAVRGLGPRLLDRLKPLLRV